MTAYTDDELFRRGTATLVASFEQYARNAAGAAVLRLSGVAAAVFPSGPERSVYNNAVLDRGLGAPERATAIAAMEAAYRNASVTDFAAWVHETDTALGGDLERRGYTVSSSTLAMGVSLDELQTPRPELDLAPVDWEEYLRTFEMPAGLLAGGDRSGYRVLVAHVDCGPVATAMAFDFRSDCGIYNVGTVEHARRRGLGTAITATILHDARDRGCRTASLQSTEIAEHVYAAVGFRALGRIVEYGPPSTASTGSTPRASEQLVDPCGPS